MIDASPRSHVTRHTLHDGRILEVIVTDHDGLTEVEAHAVSALDEDRTLIIAYFPHESWPDEARRTTYVLGQAKPGQKKPRARKRPRRKKGAP